MHGKGLLALQDKGFHSLSHPRGVGCTNTMPVRTASVKVFHISSNPSSRANNMDQSMRFKNLPIDALELARRPRLVMVFFSAVDAYPL